MDIENLKRHMTDLMVEAIKELKQSSAIAKRFYLLQEGTDKLDDCHVVLAQFSSFTGVQLATAYALSLADEMGATVVMKLEDFHEVRLFKSVEEPEPYLGDFYSIIITAMVKNGGCLYLEQVYKRDANKEIRLIGSYLGKERDHDR